MRGGFGYGDRWWNKFGVEGVVLVGAVVFVAYLLISGSEAGCA